MNLFYFHQGKPKTLRNLNIKKMVLEISQKPKPILELCQSEIKNLVFLVLKKLFYYYDILLNVMSLFYNISLIKILQLF
jgi:hypothetical protein